MKIYFAGSIRGGRDDRDFYFSIINELQKYGTILTEHIGDKELSNLGEVKRTDKEIFDRDTQWIREADLIVAEVSTPSLGVGYELGQAESMSKPVLCLYRETEGKRLSAMISGNNYFNLHLYKDIHDVVTIFRTFFQSELSA